MDKRFRHGEASHGNHSSLYRVWSSIIQRTTNPNNIDYDYYGGRGIKVCDEWKSSANFIEWAKLNGYIKGLEIDRIDNNNGYNPNNCRFVTKQDNLLNRNKRREWGIYELCNGYSIRITRNNIQYYLGREKDIEKAIAIRDSFLDKLNNKKI